MKKYSKSIATQLFYQPTPIDTAIYEMFVCYNHKTKYTNWCPIPNDGGWGICLIHVKTCERGRVKDFEQQVVIDLGSSDLNPTDIKVKINQSQQTLGFVNIKSWGLKSQDFHK